jgi:hypothetical protein
MVGAATGYGYGMAPTQPDRTTRDEEELEARKAHEAGRGPTDAEADAADSVTPDPAVARHEREMLEKGAHQQGEGRLP